MSSPSADAAAAATALPVGGVANDASRPSSRQGASNESPAEDTPNKGGHILRKRARVDYKFEHVEDTLSASNSLMKGRKRKAGLNDDLEGHVYAQKRRGASLGAEPHQSPIPPRRHLSRKSLDMRSFMEAPEEEQGTIQDTIEVGGMSYPESDALPDYEHRIQQQQQQQQRDEPQGPAPLESAQPDSSYDDYYDEESSAVPPPYGWVEGQDPKPSYQPSMNEDVPDASVYPGDPDIQLQEESYEAQFQQNPMTAQMQPHNTYQNSPQPLDPALFAEAAGSPTKSAAPKVEPANERHLHRPSNDAANDTTSFDTLANKKVTIHLEDSSQVSDTPNFEENKEVDHSWEDTQQTPPSSESLQPHSEPVTKQSQDSLPTAKLLSWQPNSSDSQPSIPDTPQTATASEHKHENRDAVSDIEPAVSTVAPDEEARPHAETVSDDVGVDVDVDADGEMESDASNHNPSVAKAEDKADSSGASETQEQHPVGRTPTTSGPASTLAAVTRSAKKKNRAEKAATDDPAEPPSSDSKELANKTAGKSPSGRSSSIIPGLEIAFNKSHFRKAQPKPVGRWAYLTPYLEGEYVTYPEQRRGSHDAAAEDPATEERYTDKEAVEPMVEDTEDGDTLAPTPLPVTPRGGSPALDTAEPTAFNSPVPGVEFQEDGEASGSEEPQERQNCYSFRKARDPDELLAALQSTEDLDTCELLELIEAANVSMAAWRDEYLELQPLVDDDANAQRRRLADQKYETRTRDLSQHGVNWEEAEFQLKGYQVKKREPMTDNRYLQEQDRIMAAAYGFPYDNHPSKIGKQNPESRNAGGIMTRGRTLRNQPKQTAKATEADEVVGKRQRKPVQPFEALTAATQEISRSSTPITGTRGRRRRAQNQEPDAPPSRATGSFNKELGSDSEATQPRRRRRNARADPATEEQTSVLAQDLPAQEPATSQKQASPAKTGRRSRGRNATKPNDGPLPSFRFVEETRQPDPKPNQPRHLITLKVPKGRNVLGTSNTITDSISDSRRPSTSASESSSHTAESSYSFRPKRQKRFRDEPDEEESMAPQPRKRAKKSQASTGAGAISREPGADATDAFNPDVRPKEQEKQRRMHKIKVIRNPASTPVPATATTTTTTAGVPSESRTGTPASLPNSTGDGGDDGPKDYRSMTKSEKMSASMKSRWANGNMAGAVEKRKATLAAKKAAQAAAEQKVGPIAPKPKKGKKEKDNGSSASSTTPQPQPNPPHQHQYHIQPPMMHPQHMPPQMHEPEPDMYMQHQYQQPYHQQHYVQQSIPPLQVPPHHPHQHPPPPPPPPAQPQPRGPPPFITNLPGLEYMYSSK